MSSQLATAFALMLVLEGVMPFVAPAAWRDVFRKLSELADGQIRFVGMCSMAVGLLILFLLQS
jgi:uncharacterized protein